MVMEKKVNRCARKWNALWVNVNGNSLWEGTLKKKEEENFLKVLLANTIWDNWKMFYTEGRIRHEPGEKHKMWLDLTMECINMAWFKLESNKLWHVPNLRKHGMENEENSSIHDQAWLQHGMRMEKTKTSNSKIWRIIKHELAMKQRNRAW